MEYKQLKELLFQHECNHPDTHLTACITFGSDNKTAYPWNSRTYLVSSDNKAFQPNKGGYSIFGDCLDGTDQGVRLEQYIKEEYGGKDGWVVESSLGALFTESKFCEIVDVCQRLAGLETRSLVDYIHRGSLEIKDPGADEEGICPICGGELEYGDDEPLDDGGVYEWTCPSCGATGKEGYNKVFDKHYDVYDGDGNPYERDQ